MTRAVITLVRRAVQASQVSSSKGRASSIKGLDKNLYCRIDFLLKLGLLTTGA